MKQYLLTTLAAAAGWVVIRFLDHLLNLDRWAETAANSVSTAAGGNKTRTVTL